VAAKKLVPKFESVMCDQMISMGKEGASQKMMWSQLGISKNTADAWKKKYPEFAEALDIALVHAQSYWETQLLANVENKNFNSRLVEIALRGQFQQDYRETRDTKIDLKAEIKVDYQKEINELLAALKT
jgi:transposase